MQELPPFSLIFGLLFDFISPFFIATSHFYIAALHHSSTSQLYIAVLHRTPTSHRTLCRIATYVASHPTSHRTLRRIAPYVASHPTSHRIAPRSIASPLP